MADLIVGVVVDVLVHVLVQHRKGSGVGWISGSAGDFGVLDSAEFVVLLPQIGFDDFSAARNRRMFAPPPPRSTLALAVGALANSPAPMVPAPTASEVPKKE